MAHILRRLQVQGFDGFERLFDVSAGVASLVVSFLAVLELSRELLIEITQSEALAPIYVRSREFMESADAATVQA